MRLSIWKSPTRLTSMEPYPFYGNTKYSNNREKNTESTK